MSRLYTEIIPASIEEQIKTLSEKDISYRTLHTYGSLYNEETDEQIQFPYISITSKYKDFFNNITVTLVLTDDLLRIYRYNPKRLSFDLYGTTEFWFELLRINNMASVTEFNKKTIKVYNAAQLKTILNEVLILEEISWNRHSGTTGY